MREEILGRKPKAAREITRRRYVNERAGVKGMKERCSSLAKMSPQNCLAILSPPPIGSSPQKRRRSDERVGAEGEPERDSTDACGAANHRRAGNGGERSKAFGDFSTADEATAAQAETARG